MNKATKTPHPELGGHGVRADAKWTAQGLIDAKQDRTSIPYEGYTPNRMVCDTTLRLMPDGSWIYFMLAGGDTEPSPQNYTAITRSTITASIRRCPCLAVRRTATNSSISRPPT